MHIDTGFKIKKLREQRNISQEDLADQLEISQSYLSKIENNTTRIDFLFMQKVCELFDVALDYFMEDGVIYNNIENKGILLNNNNGTFNNFPEEVVKNLYKNQEQISKQQDQITKLMEVQNKLVEKLLKQ